MVSAILKLGDITFWYKVYPLVPIYNESDMQKTTLCVYQVARLSLISRFARLSGYLGRMRLRPVCRRSRVRSSGPATFFHGDWS